MELTLIKTREYKLEPYGHFVFKWKKNLVKQPHHICIAELNIKHDTGMPMTKEQEKEIVKLMKKHKTDVLTDGYSFYTRSGNDLTEVWHEKLSKYKTDIAYKQVVDAVENFR